MRKLTTKQQRFVDFYDGNGIQTAREAGYTGDDNTLAQMANQNLKLPHIAQAIRARELDRIKGPIMTREQRQEFWTDMALNAKHAKDRLQASRLLAKSECDFVIKTEVVYPDQIKYSEEDKTLLAKLSIERAKEMLEKEKKNDS